MTVMLLMRSYSAVSVMTSMTHIRMLIHITALIPPTATTIRTHSLTHKTISSMQFITHHMCTLTLIMLSLMFTVTLLQATVARTATINTLLTRTLLYTSHTITAMTAAT